MADFRQRLVKGATILGELWNSQEWCPEGWKGVECECPEKSRFCRAKKQWIDLALQDGRMIEEGDFGLVLMMRAREWDATKLTMQVEVPNYGLLKIGPKGSITMEELSKVTPDALPSIMMVMKQFPGSHVTDDVFAGLPVNPEIQFPKKRKGESHGTGSPGPGQA